MAETINFPNGGFEIVVVNKKDIIDCIDNNIIDKDVMYDLISHLEVTADKYLSEGHKISVPHIGTIRKSPGKLMDKENKQLYSDAAKTLNRQDYMLLRKSIAQDNDKVIRYNRTYRAICATLIRKNSKVFCNISRKYGDTYAKLYVYFRYNVSCIFNRFEIMNGEEIDD